MKEVTVKKAYRAAKKVLKNNIDLIISFGLAGGMNPKIKNSEIIIPKKVLNKNLNSIKLLTFLILILKKNAKRKLFLSVNLITSEKVLNKKINNFIN